MFLNNPFSFLINLNLNLPNSENVPLCILDYKFFNFKASKLKRFLFLTTNFQLNKLGNSKQIFIDGTFKSCPANFYQILIIHAFDFETKIKLPVFFILMTSKTSEIYNLIFLNLKNILINKGFNIIFEIFHCDFEKALINAVLKKFQV